MTEQAMKAGSLYVELYLDGEMQKLPVRVVTVRDEEHIEEAYPAPTVPVITAAGGGARVPDFADMNYLQANHKVERNRSLARAARALLPCPVTEAWGLHKTDELKERVEILKDHLQDWQVKHLAKVLLAPKKLTEEDVAKEMPAILPTSAAETERS